MDGIWPPGNNSLTEAFRGHRSKVIEATGFKFEVRCDLKGHLEATMASEATKKAVRANMHVQCMYSCPLFQKVL